MKTTKETVKQEKKGSELKELFSLWKRTSKNGVEYLSGKTINGENLVAYYTTEKKNPKQPDIRVYVSNEKDVEQLEVASIWVQLSKNDKSYYTGKTNENERIVGFINENASEENKQPNIRFYISTEK